MARIGLTQLPRKLAEHKGKLPPTYRKCFDGAVNGLFPAEFSGSRWTVALADLDVIAAALGMEAPGHSRPAQKSRKATVAA